MKVLTQMLIPLKKKKKEIKESIYSPVYHPEECMRRRVAMMLDVLPQLSLIQPVSHQSSLSCPRKDEPIALLHRVYPGKCIAYEAMHY